MMFQPKVGEWHNYWGYKFKWTPEHLTSEQLQPLLYTYDVLAAEAIDSLDKFAPPAQAPAPEQAAKAAAAVTEAKAASDDKEKTKPHNGRRDLFRCLKDNAHKDAKLQALWDQVNTVPEWVDWDQIERGQKVFYRYAGAMVIALTFQSLVGGMGGHRVVETLSRTGGFNVSVTRRRLLETFQHILQVTASLDSVRPGAGAGFASSVRVRLLHATVRRRLLQLAASKPGYYSVADHGVPVNDLHCLGTVTAFCATALFIGLPRQCVRVTDREAADYVALWRYVAHLLGTPPVYSPTSTSTSGDDGKREDLLATPRGARVLMESLIANEIRPTPTGQVLANNVLTGLTGQPPVHASRAFLAAETYWLNGWLLSAELGVERPPLYYFALVAGQCVLFWALAWAAWLFPGWDEGKIETRRRLMYKITVENAEMGGLGKETMFEFKYIPTLKNFRIPEPPAAPGGVGGKKKDEALSSSSSSSWAAAAPRGVERRNLLSLVGAVVALSVLLWVGVRLTSGVLWLGFKQEH